MERKTGVEEAYQIMVKIGGMYRQGRFDEVNDILRNIDLDNMTDQAVITYLVVSRWAKDKLQYREEFYKKAERVLKSRGRQTKELLQGLE